MQVLLMSVALMKQLPKAESVGTIRMGEGYVSLQGLHPAPALYGGNPAAEQSCNRKQGAMCI